MLTRDAEREKMRVMTGVLSFVSFAPAGSLLLIIHAVHGGMEIEGWSLLKRRRGKEKRSNSEEQRAGLRLLPPPLLSALLSASVS